MKNASITLDGSKFSWHNGAHTCDGVGLVDDHPSFPKGGRPPAEVAVRSHRTGAVVAFKFVELSEDPFYRVTLNYEGRLPDGRYCALSLAAD